MIPPLVLSQRPQRGLAAPMAALAALVLAVGLLPLPARAQFSGSADTDLTSRNTTDTTRINDNTSNGGNNNGSNSSGNGSGSSSGDYGNTDSGDTDSYGNTALGGPNRLRQPSQGNRGPQQPEPRQNLRLMPYAPSEFERYVAQLPDAMRVRRFGSNLVADDLNLPSSMQDPFPAVPGDYVVRQGDEVVLTMWGTVDADLHLTVDRGGNIAVPRVGSIHVAGVRNSELPDTIASRVARTYRNFQLTASLGQVRAIRVFVAGYVQRPGTITLNGLSSVLHAVMRAGGPSAAGSFRDIHLRRAGKEVAVFDLYDLLLKGDRATDQLVQPDDIIFVGPVGPQVAMLGSVNQQAIYELRAGETLGDALRMAGDFTAVADRTRVSIERLADRAAGRVTQLSLPEHSADRLATGDVVRAFSMVSATLPQQFQNEHVRVEGEVAHPGDYILPPGSHMEDALRAAGGMTAAAYPFGTEFARESVRKTQQTNYERALRDLETEIAKKQASTRVASAEELSGQTASTQSSSRLLERLRQIKPTGRVVLQLSPDTDSLPNLALEDGDTISIPSRGTAVGIFGSVFNTGSFAFEPGHTTQQYLALAGGPTRGADKGSIFMIRANGSVISARQNTSFWHSDNSLNDMVVLPGDTVFVPEELDKSTFVQDAKDWTQILYQFGLGLAGIKSLGL
ncbi:MAG: SLBB domain-containing protein [Burkholderiales bacterium]|nr:SLBB domain-containing protein [Burkholderiales bacterium]